MNSNRFYQMCLDVFGFLIDEYSFSHPEVSGYTVTFSSENVSVKIWWENREFTGDLILQKLDARKRVTNEIGLDTLIAVRAPEFMRSCEYPTVPLSEPYVEQQLTQMASILSTYAKDIFKGDFSLFKEADELLFHAPCLKAFSDEPEKMPEKPWDAFIAKDDVYPGVIFAMLTTAGYYLYGKVIATDAEVNEQKNQVLVYIYDARSSNLDDIPALDKSKLLLPPIIISRNQWRLEYYYTLKRDELKSTDMLPAHCFRDSKGIYHNEYGNEFTTPMEPCGTYAVFNDRMFDLAICKALKTPEATLNQPTSQQLSWWEKIKGYLR